MRLLLAGALLALAGGSGCSGNDDDGPPKLLDTGWFTGDPGVDPNSCTDRFVTWSPEQGATDWYWRDRPVFFTESTNRAAYEVWLQDDEGVRLATAPVWDETTGLSFTVEWDGWLKPDTDYTLGFTDCTGPQQVTFRTSPLGEPLDDEPVDLVGNTYLLDLVHADWLEPPVLGVLMQQYFTDPILLGVRYADEVQIDLLAAPGKTDELGVVQQNVTLGSWDFPLADFTEAPYLDAPVDQITLTYDEVEIPVHDFLLQATFSSDGARLGGGVLSGLADSRDLGSLLNDPDNPAALCDLAASVGVPCGPCPDGLPFCLFLRAVDLEGELLPGVVLVDTD